MVEKIEIEIFVLQPVEHRTVLGSERGHRREQTVGVFENVPNELGGVRTLQLELHMNSHGETFDLELQYVRIG